MSGYLALIPFLFLVGAAAVTGSQFMPGEWYLTLQKPAWTPPGWLFGPVWTLLYIMIAVAGWRVWRAAGVGPALVVWGTGLALNALWSWLMFGIHRIDLALVDIVALLASIAVFIALAWRVDRVAAWLFVPYVAWVGFATALNFAIWRMN
jgi:tryptophan-rich sensory protein